MKTFDQELTTGSLNRAVWKLAWPGATMYLISGLQGFVGHMLVGRYRGYTGNAAVGDGWQLFLMAMVFIISVSQGMSVLVARYAGKQDREAVNRVVYHTFLWMAYISIFVGVPVGYWLTPYLLPLVKPKPEEFAEALPFLRVLFMNSAPFFVMIVITNALQAAGDPKTSLKLGVLATAMNVLITATLIRGVGRLPSLGTMAPALGTTLAPLISNAIAIVLIARGQLIIGLPRTMTLKPDPSILWAVARIGIPTGIQNVVLNVGGTLLLWFIGHLANSVQAHAAYTICYTQIFSFIVWTSFGLRNAATTIMGQNLGAGRIDRGRTGVWLTTGLAVTWSAALGLLFWTAPRALLDIFHATDPAVLELGSSLLKYLAVSGLFVSSALVITGGLVGAGDTKRPMYIALVSQVLVLVGFCAVMQTLGHLNSHTIWFSVLLAHVTRFVLTYWVFQQGQWAHIHVELDR